MSEKAVIELSKEELELLYILLFRGIDEVSNDDAEEGVKLSDNIAEQARKNRSIIEWNLPFKTPHDGLLLVKRSFRTKPQVVLFKLGRFETLLFEPIPNADIDALAYLPES